MDIEPENSRFPRRTRTTPDRFVFHASSWTGNRKLNRPWTDQTVLNGRQQLTRNSKHLKITIHGKLRPALWYSFHGLKTNSDHQEGSTSRRKYFYGTHCCEGLSAKRIWGHFFTSSWYHLSQLLTKSNYRIGRILSSNGRQNGILKKQNWMSLR